MESGYFLRRNGLDSHIPAEMGGFQTIPKWYPLVIADIAIENGHRHIVVDFTKKNGEVSHSFCTCLPEGCCLWVCTKWSLQILMWEDAV